MSDLAEVELRRARWRRSLEALALDRAERDDFATGGLASRLADPTSVVSLIPGDPEAAPVDLDSSLQEWLQSRGQVELGRARFPLPTNLRRTAHAMALVNGYGDDWSSYLAVHRSGSIEFGLGDRGGWTQTGQDGKEQRRINLTPLVARVWVALRLAVELETSHGILGPYQLAVGVRGTRGAFLGGLGEGWAEPDSFENHFGPCPEKHLLWRLELASLPDDDGARKWAYAIGDRMEDAWGVAQRRYLAYRGEFVDELDPRWVR